MSVYINKSEYLTVKSVFIPFCGRNAGNFGGRLFLLAALQMQMTHLKTENVKKKEKKEEALIQELLTLQNKSRTGRMTHQNKLQYQCSISDEG